MKVLKPVAAAALVGLSASAFAVGPGALGTIDNTPIVIGNSVSGFFFDTYTFMLADPGMLSGVASSLEVPPALGIANFTVLLQNAAFATIGSDTTPGDGFSFSGLSAGSYAVSFLGFTTGSAGGAYGGALYATTAPIPEPETYALMLGGLAAVGFMAYRRRRV